jgi:hypothetical protein
VLRVEPMKVELPLIKPVFNRKAPSYSLAKAGRQNEHGLKKELSQIINENYDPLGGLEQTLSHEPEFTICK